MSKVRGSIPRPAITRRTSMTDQLRIKTSGPPPKDWTKATTSELVAEVAFVAKADPHLLQFSSAAKELDRRFPVPA